VAGNYGPCLNYRDRIIPICCFVPTAFAITCITLIKDSKLSSIFKGYVFVGLANHNKSLSNCRKSTNSVERISKLLIISLIPSPSSPPRANRHAQERKIPHVLSRSMIVSHHRRVTSRRVRALTQRRRRQPTAERISRTSHHPLATIARSRLPTNKASREQATAFNTALTCYLKEYVPSAWITGWVFLSSPLSGQQLRKAGGLWRGGGISRDVTMVRYSGYERNMTFCIRVRDVGVIYRYGIHHHGICISTQFITSTHQSTLHSGIDKKSYTSIHSTQTYL
jgi:hypothetical protein